MSYSYSLPVMDECIDNMGDKTKIFLLDLNWDHWKTPLRRSDRDKTTLECHEGTNRLHFMQFGIKNSPETFQRTLDIVFVSYKRKRTYYILII